MFYQLDDCVIMYWDYSVALPSTANKILRLLILWYPLISNKLQFMIMSFPILILKNKNEDRVNKNNCYYYPFNLTCLLTMYPLVVLA